MPPSVNQHLVPVADVGFYTAPGATVRSFKARLRGLAIPFNENDLKYALYYRIAVSGNRILTMPVGYVPAIPPLPPGWAPLAVAAPPAPRKLYIVLQALSVRTPDLLTLDISFAAAPSPSCPSSCSPSCSARRWKVGVLA